jgi:hypothetical protein
VARHRGAQEEVRRDARSHVRASARSLVHSVRMAVARYPFRRIGREYLGTIRRPYATVLVQGKSRKWVSVEMVVDSGADYTLLPATYAELLGIDLAACVPATTSGVGGSEIVHLYKSLDVRLGDWRAKVPVGFLDRDDVPALLGRLRFMEALEVVFKDFTTTFGRWRRSAIIERHEAYPALAYQAG